MRDHLIIKLDLGWGIRNPEGFLGVDRFALPEVDLIADLNQTLPYDLELKAINNQLKNIQLTTIPRSLSIDQTLLKYGKWNIDLPVHPGPEISNNRYKTVHLLLIAAQLGAVLVVPNRPPFEGVEDRENLFVTVDDDSPKGWRDSIEGLLHGSLRDLFDFGQGYRVT